MNFIVGSVTPYTSSQKINFKEPSFQVMTIDPDTLIPLTLKTYAFNISHSNLFNDPSWSLQYDNRETYALQDLSPSSFMKYASSMYWNSTAA